MSGTTVHAEIIQRAAAILGELGHEIERLGAELCSDPAIVERHLTALQTIDLIAQQQHAIATLLRADCVATGINDIGMEHLKHRLRA